MAGNYIGTNRSGLGSVGNCNSGVQIKRGTSNTQIGTDGDGGFDNLEANAISSNRTGYRSLSGASEVTISLLETLLVLTPN